MKEDTLMRIPRDAFGSLACVHKCKSAKANQAVTSSSEAEYWTDDNSEAGSNNDFLEDAESTEDERIAIQFASKNDELLQALEEDSDSSDKASAWGRRRVWQHLNPASPGTSMEGSQQVEDLGSLGRRSQGAIKKTPLVTPGQRLPNGVWWTARTAWSKDARKLVLRAQHSAWPQWVYHQYDAYDLARRAAGM
jgi:cereblon